MPEIGRFRGGAKEGAGGQPAVFTIEAAAYVR
jgi:hypothetical protein